MILLLATRTDPLRQLLPAALEAASPGQSERLLVLDPTAPGDLALQLSAGEGALSGRFRSAGETYEWDAISAAWIADSAAPELGSAYELLLEGLDLASFPVVGRPQVRETLACDTRLDELADCAGLGRPDRSWLAAGHDPGEHQLPRASPEPLVSVWRGGRELHGAAAPIRPWIAAITRFADEAQMLFGRIDLEPQLAAPPRLLRVVTDLLPGTSIDELPKAPRQALLALAEHLARSRR